MKRLTLAIVLASSMLLSQHKNVEKTLSVNVEQTLSANVVRRIELAKCKGYNDEPLSNCIGTALYLIGRRSLDEHIDPEKAYQIVHSNKYKGLKSPRIGSIITWESLDSVDHMGLVVGKDPLLITERVGYGGPLIEENPYWLVNKRYHEKKNYFYVPVNKD